MVLSSRAGFNPGEKLNELTKRMAVVFNPVRAPQAHTVPFHSDTRCREFRNTAFMKTVFRLWHRSYLALHHSHTSPNCRYLLHCDLVHSNSCFSVHRIELRSLATISFFMSTLVFARTSHKQHEAMPLLVCNTTLTTKGYNIQPNCPVLTLMHFAVLTPSSLPSSALFNQRFLPVDSGRSSVLLLCGNAVTSTANI